MAEKLRKSGKKNRKHNRNIKKCKRYRDNGIRIKNKARKIYNRIKNYSVPENQLNGLSGELKDKVKSLLM